MHVLLGLQLRFRELCNTDFFRLVDVLFHLTDLSLHYIHAYVHYFNFWIFQYVFYHLACIEALQAQCYMVGMQLRFCEPDNILDTCSNVTYTQNTAIFD